MTKNRIATDTSRGVRWNSKYTQYVGSSVKNIPSKVTASPNVGVRVFGSMPSS